MNAKLEKLLNRCNEMDITEQLNWLGDANMPYQAKLEYAALTARLEQAEAERDAAKKLSEFAYHVGGCDPKKDGTCLCGFWDVRDRYAAALAKGEGK